MVLFNARTIMDTIISLLKEAPKDIAKNEIQRSSYANKVEYVPGKL
jgi:hypothetical protein